MPASISFTLKITLGYGSEVDSETTLNKACTQRSTSSLFGGGGGVGFFSGTTGSNNLFVASASTVDLSVDQTNDGTLRKPPQVSYAAIFVPPLIVESSLGKITANTKTHALGSCFWLKEPHSSRLANDLLSRIHRVFFNCKIRGIIVTSIAAEQNAPSEIVLLDLSSAANKSLADLVQDTNGSSMVDNKDAIIKILPISKITFTTTEDKEPRIITEVESPQATLLPMCPVCLHRIDPVKLGLPKPSNQHLCSKFCTPPSFIRGSWEPELSDFCPKQRFLKPWPAPSRCAACNVIQRYWNHLTKEDEAKQLFCEQCSMHNTLWVCLTCGFVGCGRYSNRHSVEHFADSGHQYALELSTNRIWDYTSERYAHRVDLLDCPSSPPLAHPWMIHSSAGSAAASSTRNTAESFGKNSFDNFHPMDAEKSPKKATMIGEEYEALLQSALEDQAQHYEGEISRLRAELTAASVDEESMTIEEQRIVEELKADIGTLRKDIEVASQELLDAQAEEADQRATSQGLLKEQQVANELLAKIQDEAKLEHQQGRLQVEEMEQQIADLTANLKMRQQFSQSVELSNAQIFGTTSSDTRSSKRGKKKGRFFRK